MACDKNLKKIVEYLIYNINRRVPFAEIIYSMLEVSDEMPQIVEENYTFATDGVKLYVRETLLKKYQINQKELEIQLLHELLHIYLGHPVMAKGKKREAYDRKCDEMVKQWIVGGYPYQERIHNWEWLLRKEYENHVLWYENSSREKQGSGQNGNNTTDASSKENGGAVGMDELREKMKEVWENIKTMVSMLTSPLQTEQSVLYGTQSGAGGQGVGVRTEKADSYIDILKKYVEIKELPYDTEEEIDVMLYTYGLELYEDIPLIEPPEVTELLRGKFYMAIDTSGSCAGEMVERFLGQTKSVLEELTADGKKELDIYLFLCDTEIGQEFHITDMSEFPKMSELQIPGGGTSFIPVFQRIEELQKKDGNGNATALFYYTDGAGECPEKKPTYDVYFLMEKQDMEYFHGPKWIKTVEM